MKLGIHVDSGQMHCVYQNQAAAAYSLLYSFFFLSNFQTLKFFVTLFSGTVRLRRLKVGTHVDSGHLNIFSSKTTGPIEAKFHMESPWNRGTKVCSNGPGHMTKMAAMPIYVKNLKKSSPEPKGR